VGKEGRYGKAKRDDGKAVEVDEEKDGVRVGVVDHGAVAGRYKEQAGDEDAADCQRRRELERPRAPMQVTLHAHQLHRLLQIMRYKQYTAERHDMINLQQSSGTYPGMGLTASASQNTTFSEK